MRQLAAAVVEAAVPVRVVAAVEEEAVVAEVVGVEEAVVVDVAAGVALLRRSIRTIRSRGSPRSSRGPTAGSARST